MQAHATELPLIEIVRRLHKRVKGKSFQVAMKPETAIAAVVHCDGATDTIQCYFPLLNKVNIVFPTQNKIMSINVDNLTKMLTDGIVFQKLTSHPSAQTKALHDLEHGDPNALLVLHALVRADQELVAQGHILEDTEQVWPWQLDGLGSVDKKDSALSLIDKLDTLVGADQLRHEVLSLLSYAHMTEHESAAHSLVQPMWFVGAKGTGKTKAARLVGDILFASGLLKTNDPQVRNCRVIEIDKHDLQDHQPLISEMRKKIGQLVIGGSLPAVVCIKDAEDVFQAAATEATFEREIVAAFKKIAEEYGEHVLLIFMGRSLENVENLRPSFGAWAPTVISFADHNPARMVEMWATQAEENGYELDLEENFGALLSVAENAHAAVGEAADHGRLAATIFKRAVMVRMYTAFVVPGNSVPVPHDNARVLTGEHFTLAAMELGFAQN